MTKPDADEGARAAIDVGTNSVRLLLVGRGSELRRSTVTGLGRGVDATRRISDDALDRTLEVLSDYAAELQRVPRVRAVTTSVARDATNRDVLVRRAGEVLGVPLELISGEEEARLSFRGATTDLGSNGDVVVSDIGGGSTEFVWSTDSGVDAVSVDIGSVRLTDRLLTRRPVPFDVLEEAVYEVEQAFAPVPVDAPRRVIGVAGTWTSLAAMAEPERSIHGAELERHVIEGLVLRLAGSSIAETERIRGLDPARAPVILGGAIVAREVLRHLQAPSCLVSGRDLLDGVILTL